MGSLYEQDFISWTEQQAGMLRAESQRRTNAALDWEHLAEEIEGLGRSELSELASQVRRIVLHLLKLEFSPAMEPRRGWRDSIDDARAEIESRVRRDPGLKARLDEIIDEEGRSGAKRAVKAMQTYDEDASAILARLQTGRIYTQAQILGDWFPGDPNL